MQRGSSSWSPQGSFSGLCPVKQQVSSLAPIVMSETDKMASLVDEILCLSRIESGQVQLKIESVCVADSVNNCLITLESVILKKGLRIETDMAGSCLPADAAQLDTAVINLLSNAVKYASHRIVILFDGRKLSIWNDGSSIDKEEAARIFDRFYIGKTGNTGIGLALTKEIIERHGWRIRVENGSAGGTQFVVDFLHA